LERGLELYKNKVKCFSIGDFNCRTGESIDILEDDMYTNENNQLSNTVNIPPRVSQDHVVDGRPGKRLIEFCLSTGLVIGNGR